MNPRPYMTVLLAIGLSIFGIVLAQSNPADAAVTYEIVAHRGGTAPAESTIAAIHYAAAKGATAVEFDVRYTRDGKPIVMHDSTVDRTTGCAGPVGDLTLAALRKCKVDRAPGAKVPTYEEAITTAKGLGLKVFVHMKQGGPGQVKTLVSYADKQKYLPRTVFVSDNLHSIERAKANGAKWYGPVVDQPGEWTRLGQYVLPYATAVTPELVAAAHKAGKRVYPVESAGITPAGVLGLGVDGILINDMDGALGG